MALARRRGALGQIAQATERDRAQTAAHDEAMKAELSKLPTPQVAQRHQELSGPASAETRQEDDYTRQAKEVQRCRERYEQAVAQREAAEGLPRRERRAELPRAREREQAHAERLQVNAEVLRGMERPGDSARREREVAARVKPPEYVTRELGSRPADAEKAKAWERGVRGIEGYRQEHGITDKKSALGQEPKGPWQRAAQVRAQRRIQEAQRRLGKQLARSRDTGRGLGLGR